MKFRIEGDIKVTTESLKLIDHAKALIELEPGCIWVPLHENGSRIGLAFAGPGRFVVDAIIETPDGAIGDSESGRLSGVQFYLGDSGIESISRVVSESDYPMNGYADETTFKKAVESKMEGKEINTDGTFSSDRDGSIFLGNSEDDESLLLVVNPSEPEKLVFSHGKQIAVIGGDSHVSVGKDGVAVTGRDGKSIVIDKHGIRGLEGLAGIGPTIAKTVGRSMKSLKGLKHLKHIKKGRRLMDEVEALDWDDDDEGSLSY